jgi:hypothetical protein
MAKRTSILRQNKLPIIEINSCYQSEYPEFQSSLKTISFANKFGIKLNNLNSFDLDHCFKDILQSNDCIRHLDILIINSELNSETMEKLAQILPSLNNLRELDIVVIKTDSQFSKFIKYIAKYCIQKKIKFIHYSKNKESHSPIAMDANQELQIICADNLNFQSLDFYKFIYQKLSQNPISIRSEQVNKNLGNLPLLQMNFTLNNSNKNLIENQINQGLQRLSRTQNLTAQLDKNFENTKSILNEVKKNILKVNPNNRHEFFGEKCAREFSENIPQDRFKLLSNF